jgi:hypothetical protein
LHDGNGAYDRRPSAWAACSTLALQPPPDAAASKASAAR